MTGTRLSELSERKILGGNQHALPAGMFPDEVDYVALGHLHLAQQVGERENLRYSGSPIPLSLDEAAYPHQVVQVDMAAPGNCAVTPLVVPRAVEILRIPARGALTLDDAIAALARLALPNDGAAETWPFVEVRLRLERPEPGMRQRLDEAVVDRPVRLLKVSAAYTGSGQALGDAVPAIQLEELAPDEVFGRRYAQSFEDDPPAELVAAFHELVDSVREED
jgi:exonuclease SbcD